MGHGHVDHVKASGVREPKPILFVAVVTADASAVFAVDWILAPGHSPLVVDVKKDLMCACPRFSVVVNDEIAGGKAILLVVTEDARILEMLLLLGARDSDRDAVDWAVIWRKFEGHERIEAIGVGFAWLGSARYKPEAVASSADRWIVEFGPVNLGLSKRVKVATASVAFGLFGD